MYLISINRKRLYTIISIIILLSIIITLLYIQWTIPSPPTNNTTTTAPPQIHRVLIYDSLAREYPNTTVIKVLKSMFKEYGYEVDIYIGKNATLDPLFNLDKYGIIILRAHGAYNSDPLVNKPLGSYVYTGIYIDEAIKIYGKDYIDKMLNNNMIVLGVIPPPGEKLTKELIDRLPKYVVVSPLFFNKNIKELHRSIIIFTGCYGFDDDILAKIFIKKGAEAYISFKGNVTWSHGDAVLDALMRTYLATHNISRAYYSLKDKLKIDLVTGAELKILLKEHH